jgi:hypothetical protein
MSDLRTRSGDVVKTLGSIQRHILDTCSDNLYRLVNARVDHLWDEGVHSTEYFIRASLKGQADLATLIADQITTCALAPRSVIEATESLHSLVQDLTLTEAGVLINMGDLVRLFDPFRAAYFVRGNLKRSRRTVKDIGPEAIDEQLDLISGWTYGRDGSNGGGSRGMSTITASIPRRRA